MVLCASLQCLAKLFKLCLLYKTMHPRLNHDIDVWLILQTLSRPEICIGNCYQAVFSLFHAHFTCPCHTSTTYGCHTSQACWRMMPSLYVVNFAHIHDVLSQASYAGAVFLNPCRDFVYRAPSNHSRLARQAAMVTGPLQLLAALPALWIQLNSHSVHGAAAIAVFSLEALDSRRGYWDRELQRCALPKPMLADH